MNNNSTNRYIAFDCETSGLNKESNLLTVSFIILNSELEYVDGFNISLKQMSGYYISPEALEVNKIDIIKHHKNAIDLIDARRHLLQFLNKNKGNHNLIPIGHNINFDIKFIKSSGLLTDKEYSSFISCNPLDTIVIAQFLKLCGKLNQKQSLSLVNLCTHLNLHTDNNLQHSSEYDTKMTIDLLKKFKSLFKENEQCNALIQNVQSNKRKHN